MSGRVDPIVEHLRRRQFWTIDEMSTLLGRSTNFVRHSMRLTTMSQHGRAPKTVILTDDAIDAIQQIRLSVRKP